MSSCLTYKLRYDILQSKRHYWIKLFQYESYTHNFYFNNFNFRKQKANLHVRLNVLCKFYLKIERVLSVCKQTFASNENISLKSLDKNALFKNVQKSKFKQLLNFDQ